METEDFRQWILRQSLDILDVVIVVGVLGCIVYSRRGQLVRFIEYLLIVVVLQDCHDQAAIFIVCDSNTVVTLTSQILEGIEGHFIWVLIDEYSELSH